MIPTYWSVHEKEKVDEIAKDDVNLLKFHLSKSFKVTKRFLEKSLKMN